MEIGKRTKGRSRIPVFPGGTLTPADKCYDGVLRRGTDEAGPGTTAGPLFD